MAENIGGDNLLDSGSHQWAWDALRPVEKLLGTVGADGASSTVLTVGPRMGQVRGLLRASGVSRSAADAALTALEDAIEALSRDGEEQSWEDDAGRSGTRLVVATYQRIGPRTYGRQGSDVHAWQRYVLIVRDNAAGLI